MNSQDTPSTVLVANVRGLVKPYRYCAQTIGTVSYFLWRSSERLRRPGRMDRRVVFDKHCFTRPPEFLWSRSLFCTTFKTYFRTIRYRRFLIGRFVIFQRYWFYGRRVIKTLFRFSSVVGAHKEDERVCIVQAKSIGKRRMGCKTIHKRRPLDRVFISKPLYGLLILYRPLPRTTASVPFAPGH